MWTHILRSHLESRKSRETWAAIATALVARVVFHVELELCLGILGAAGINVHAIGREDAASKLNLPPLTALQPPEPTDRAPKVQT